MKRQIIFMLGVAFAALIALAVSTGTASAQDNQECLSCHAQPGMQAELENIGTLHVTVNPDTFDQSVHGMEGVACTDCHTGITGYPHPPVTETSRRDYSIRQAQLCLACHEEQFNIQTNDAHTIARENGNLEAAVCTDCHGAHDITDPSNPPSKVAQTCQRCHSQIYELYKTSVHGEALIGEGNTDVPACVDCHNAHNVQGPSNTQFRLFSPQICARCHADEQLMAEYGVNTDVFDTYLSDFHGTTISIFQAVAPGQETNKPVCIDCHGVHDIKSPENPESAVQADRLLATCQRCHPDATPNFPASWLSHYRPSPDHYPIVYYVDLFYKFFIPIVLGGMAVFVASDIFRRATRRGKEQK